MADAPVVVINGRAAVRAQIGGGGAAGAGAAPRPAAAPAPRYRRRRPPPPPAPPASAAAARYALASPYALAVGTASARKTLQALDEAARSLRKRGIELVLAGSDRGYLRGSDGPLRRLGYVDDELLPGLYAGAVALAM